MHDYVLGFVCFMAGAFFVTVVGVTLLGGQSEEPADQSAEPSDADRRAADRRAADLPPAEPKQWPWREPDEGHPAWPECDCPSQEFHTKYYPWAGAG